MTLLLKNTVSLEGIQPQFTTGLLIAYLTWEQMFPGVNLTITSATDGIHKAKNSLHKKGLAFDLRTKTITKKKKLPFIVALRDALGPEWDVVFEDEGLENEHAHVEWDPK